MTVPIDPKDVAGLLKKTEEELQRREDQLSRINQEVYKKNLELLKEKRRLETILYNMAEAVFVLAADYTFMLFNTTAQKLLGLSEVEVVGRHCDGVVLLKDEQNNSVNFSSVLLAQTKDLKSISPGEFYLQTKAGPRVVKIGVAAIELPYDVKVEYVVILNDITAEKEITKLKDEFISIASHELRTPMTAVKGYLWMLTSGKGGELAEKGKSYLAKAVRATDRMIALIGDILNVSAIEQGRIDLKIESLRLQDLIFEEMDELKVKAEQKGLSLKIEGFDSLPEVKADRRRVLEVITNLLGNALKFTDQGSVRVEAGCQDNFVKVAVVDSGRGFSQADQEKLFRKFTRLDASLVTMAESGGTGLGLYICKMIVEKLGGQIGAESQGPGQGATFWFTLPVS